MIAEADLQEYLEEIRQEVCSRCVERPEGGPPCGPLGKVCGVELHLPQLVAAVLEVKSEWMGPYLAATREKVCRQCVYLHQDCCPCPMDSLAMLVVESIEMVERRQQRRGVGRRFVASLPPSGEAGIGDVLLAYQEAAGTWSDCDWPTSFGLARLNLNGISVGEAESLAVETAGTFAGDSWGAAVNWLALVERHAEQAEQEAAMAITDANFGNWHDAAQHAAKAWLLEFQTGRPIRRASAWERLYKTIKAAATASRAQASEA